MARPLRLTFTGGVYHVTDRGNEPTTIVCDNVDRIRLVDTLVTMVAFHRSRRLTGEDLTAVARRMGISYSAINRPIGSTDHRLARDQRFHRHIERLSDGTLRTLSGPAT